MRKSYGVDIEMQRAALLKSNVARKIYQPIIEKADKSLEKTYLALKMSEYLMFDETGDRAVFEKSYFERRNDCSYLLVAYWLTEDEKYRSTLIDLICMMCDEFTWCLPAHLHTDPLPDGYMSAVEVVDLFAAETARLLTDVYEVVGDKLPDFISIRIAYEIDRRITKPLLKWKYWWQRCTNNWASVCAAGSARAVFRFADDEEKRALMPMFESCIENFLSGYKDDGCCPEGFAYWRYGFGYFVIYADLMLEYSCGKVNYFEREKVRNIALFPQKIRMGKGKTVCFSDGGNGFSIGSGIICYLRKIYGDVVQYPSIEYIGHGGNVFSINELLWFDKDFKADELKDSTTFFEDTQWYICRCENYSYAAKGGHNGEPHNHNDVGSFMIVSADDSIPLADIGAEKYRRETFRPETRYNILNHASWGHSVPIINGDGYQIYGEEYSAKNVQFGDSTFSLDIEGAYEAGIVERIHRKFELSEKCVTLSDTFWFSDKTEYVTERFVSCIEPEISDGTVVIGKARMIFDENRYVVACSTDTYRSHNGDEFVTVYLIDFKGKNRKEDKFEFEIEIR